MEFFVGQSVTSISRWDLAAYWPSALVLIVTGLAVLRTKNLGWISLGVLALAFQQSVRLITLLRGYPHHSWLLRELLAAAVAFGVAALTVAGLATLPNLQRASRVSRISLSVAAVAAANVFLDWAFLLVLASPLAAPSP